MFVSLVVFFLSCCILFFQGSGEISLRQLKQVLLTNAGAGSLGALNEDEVEDIFNAMRVNKSETKIHWHEFIAAGLSQCQVDDRNLRLAFDRLDSDHKGVSPTRFENFFCSTGTMAVFNELSSYTLFFLCLPISFAFKKKSTLRWIT